jgi:urease accessory protein
VQPRSVGAGHIRVRADSKGRTRLADLHQAGALKLVLPQTHRKDVEAIVVNTGGGLTGGDRFTLSARADAGATLTLTTQAAERAYRAQPGEVARFDTALEVAEDAALHWLPQELILFDRAALNRCLDIRLARGARLLLVEPLVFGRAAMGERLQHLHLRDRIRITRQDVPIYLDGLDLDGDMHALLSRPAIAQGAGAMASLVLVAPDAARHLEAVRALLPATGGASMKAPDMMTLRLVAPDSFDLRRSLVPILDLLTDNRLPLSWRL